MSSRAASWSASSHPLPGLLLCAALAGLAMAAGRAAPVVGYAIPAIVLGILAGLVLRLHPHRAHGSTEQRGTSGRTDRTGGIARLLGPGIRVSSRLVLQCGVVLLGAQLTLGAILRVGTESLPVMVVSLTLCLGASRWVGRRMGIPRGLRTLIGVGTGICGASAIAAVSPVIRARNADVSYAVSTIFLFNVLGVVVFPLLGHACGLSAHAFGLFAGTAVNDTSSVVAAATVFGGGSLAFAVVVKLVRTLMIIPVSVGLAVLTARRDRRSARITLRGLMRLVPWFLMGFLVLAGLSTAGLVPDAARQLLSTASGFCVAAALAGIGLSTDPGAIRAAGIRPLLLGGILSLLVIAATLGMMALTGQLGG